MKKAYLDHLNSPMVSVAGWSGKLDGPSFEASYTSIRFSKIS